MSKGEIKMLVLALLIYIGILVDVASWYYWVCGILAFMQIIKFGMALYKAGKKSTE